MRNLLLAGVALGVMSAFVPVTPARAQVAGAATPAAVFPVTTETDLAGVNGPSLNGAAPGSVQVNLGGRTFSALYFQNSFLKNTPSWAKSPQPQFMSYFFLYPGFDYTSPSGIHFGANAEVRINNSTQGGGGGQDTFWVHEDQTYVSSPRFGKVQFGLVSGALVQNAVGTDDDYGTGVFFSWYNTGLPWVMGDAVDNDVTGQKVVYTTPTFAGFLAAISYQPTPVSLNYADNLTVAQPPGALGLLSKDRVEIAAKYSGNFGPVGLKVNGGYVFASAEKAGTATVGKNLSYGNGGLELHLAGFQLEGSTSIGDFNPNTVDNGNPDGPLPLGAKSTTAWVASVGYGAGPFKAGVVYYNVSYDDLDFGGPAGKTGHLSAEGLGASYTVGPGVVAYLDATMGSMDNYGFAGAAGGLGTFGKQHPKGLGLGTFFTW